MCIVQRLQSEQYIGTTIFQGLGDTVYAHVHYVYLYVHVHARIFCKWLWMTYNQAMVVVGL